MAKLSFPALVLVVCLLVFWATSGLDFRAASELAQPSRSRDPRSHEPEQSGMVNLNNERASTGALAESPELAPFASVSVRCKAAADGEPIGGIGVRILNADSLVVLGQQISNDSGSAAFELDAPGRFSIIASDPAQVWVPIKVVPAGGNIVASDKNSVIDVEVVLVKSAIAWFRFVGDDVLMMHTKGSVPGFRNVGSLMKGRDMENLLDQSSLWGSDGRLLPTPASPVSPEACFVYAPVTVDSGSQIATDGLPVQKILVYTRSHGVKVFQVPLIYAQDAIGPEVIDLSSADVLPSARFRLDVVDMNGEAGLIGCVTLKSRPRQDSVERLGWDIQCLIGEDCYDPCDVDYEIVVGDFPGSWSAPGFSAKWLAQSGEILSRQFALEWPTAKIKKIHLTMGGSPITGGIMTCSVNGSMAPFFRGAVNYPINSGVLPPGDYPVGKLRFVFRQGDLRWDISVNIEPGQQELLIDLPGPGNLNSGK